MAANLMRHKGRHVCPYVTHTHKDMNSPGNDTMQPFAEVTSYVALVNRGPRTFLMSTDNTSRRWQLLKELNEWDWMR